MMALLAVAMAALLPSGMQFGPPVPVGGGGKMSNTLDLYPAGVASGIMDRTLPGQGKSRGTVFTVDGGATFKPGEVLTQLVNAPNATSVSSRNGTVTYAINGEGQLTATSGRPNVTFQGLPYPLCSPGHGAPGTLTPYAGAQLILPNGTHLVTAMYTGCPPPTHVRNNGINLFRSDDGYTFTGWAAPAEGPNEHTVTLLPNNDLLAVFRTEAGDGNGRYVKFHRHLTQSHTNLEQQQQQQQQQHATVALC
eukprot:gene13783-5951_t